MKRGRLSFRGTPRVVSPRRCEAAASVAVKPRTLELAPSQLLRMLVSDTPANQAKSLIRLHCLVAARSGRRRRSLSNCTRSEAHRRVTRSLLHRKRFLPLLTEGAELSLHDHPICVDVK